MTGTRPIGLLLRTLDRLIDERFEHAIGARGVTRRQWQLLNLLAGGARSTAELTASVSPFLAAGETVHPHLEPLAGTGVVRPERDGYALTDAGHMLVADLARDVEAVRDRTVAGLPDGEYRRTVATLEAMVENLRAVS